MVHVALRLAIVLLLAMSFVLTLWGLFRSGAWRERAEAERREQVRREVAWRLEVEAEMDRMRESGDG